jgi:hypothetical protein
MAFTSKKFQALTILSALACSSISLASSVATSSPSPSPAPSSSLSSAKVANISPTFLPVSVSPTSFIDEVANSREFFSEVSYNDVIQSLSNADFISIGETHQRGMERTFITDLYDTLKLTLDTSPAHCIVENYQQLLSTDDPVRAAFNQVCPEAIVHNNLGGFNYLSLFANDFPDGKLLTHTGFRHAFPIALMYPQNDFPTPNWVDTPSRGTLVKQVPAEFVTSGKQMRGLGTRAIDDLYLSRVLTDLRAVAGPNISDSALSDEALKVKNWSKKLKFHRREFARFFEIHRINLSFPYAKSYLALLNRLEFNPKFLERLLESDQLKTLLQTTDPINLNIGCFIPDGPKETFQAGSVNITEPGTIYAYSYSLKDQHVVAVTISPTHDVRTDYSTY